MILRELIARIGFKVDDTQLKGVMRGIDSLNSKLNLIGGYVLAQRMLGITKGFAEWSQQMQVTAENLGLTTSSIQRMQLSASRMGVEAGTVTSALSSMTKMIYAAKMGSDAAWLTFARLGIKPEQVMGWKNSEEALYDMGDALKNIKDPIERAALASAALGGAGEQMITFFKQGGKGMREAGAAMNGLIISPAAIKSLAQLNQSFLLASNFARKFWADISLFLAPMVERAIQMTVQWYQANRTLIMVNIKNWLLSFAYALGFVVGILQVLVGWFRRLSDAHKLDREHWLVNATKILAYGVALLVVIGAIGKLIFWGEKLWKLFGLLKTALMWVLGVAIPWLLTGLSGIALKLAVLTSTSFPALSAALLRFGAAIEGLTAGAVAGFLGAFALMVLGIESFYRAMQGKEGILVGWLNSLWRAAEQIPVIGKLFQGLRAIEDMAIEKFAESDLGQWLNDSLDALSDWISSGRVFSDIIQSIWGTIFGSSDEGRAPNPEQPTMPSVSSTFRAAQSGIQNVEKMSAASPGGGQTATVVSANDGGGSTTQTNYFTINMQPGVDQKTALKTVQKAVNDALNLRNARIDTTSPVTH